MATNKPYGHIYPTDQIGGRRLIILSSIVRVTDQGQGDRYGRCEDHICQRRDADDLQSNVADRAPIDLSQSAHIDTGMGKRVGPRLRELAHVARGS